MARRIGTRWVISGELVAAGPLHVGGAGGGVDADLSLAVDGRGDYYVPGTSLAGAFREWMRSRAERGQVDALWGFQEQSRDPAAGAGETAGHASYILVENAPVRLPPDAVVEIRDGVGIDRVYGAAAEHIKYDRAVIPRGAIMAFEITVEHGEIDGERAGTDSPSPAQALTSDLLKALEAGEVRLGAAKTRGLGRVRLERLQIREYRMHTREGVLKALLHAGDDVDLESIRSKAGAALLRKRPRVAVEVGWRPCGPLMVKAERDGFAVDMLPLVSLVGGGLSFVLPGSSVKGTLRSHGEKIVRTVCGRRAPDSGNPKQRFIKQLDEPLISALFGASRPPADGRHDTPAQETETPRLGLGALSVDDCYSEARVPYGRWAAIEYATDEQELERALTAAGLAQAQVAHHVAVDRWTGGAADGFLYSVLEPHGVTWESIRLSLDLTRIPRGDRAPAFACLLLILRDLAAGRIPLGFGTNRGMGSVEINHISIGGIDLEEEGILSSVGGVVLDKGDLSGLGPEFRRGLNAEWLTWVDAQSAGGVNAV